MSSLDVTDFVKQVCIHAFLHHGASVHPRNVKQITLDPRGLTITHYALNEDGNKFVGENGYVALHHTEIETEYHA